MTQLTLFASPPAPHLCLHGGEGLQDIGDGVSLWAGGQRVHLGGADHLLEEPRRHWTHKR